MRPIRLRPDNFTPPSRTPWGGRRLVDDLKVDVLGADAVGPDVVVGESWEISVDPTFPSRDAASGASLAALIAADPDAWLGPRRGSATSTPMLVKLLDAAANLSVQVHPPDDYPGLAADESGKPEAWYVVDHDPGAAIYLGLAEGVDRAAVAAALRDGEDLRPMLTRVEVARGDCYVIGPGTVHAVGAGVTLVEPQLVVPCRAGKTYRFWDWGRRYDAHGRLDPAGQARELHVAHSLAVTRFDGPRGDAFVATCRRRPTLVDRVGAATREHLCDLDDLRVERVRGEGTLALPAPNGIVGLVVVRGAVVVAADTPAPVRARRGESVVVPAGLGAFTLALERDAEAIVTTMGAGASAPGRAA